MAPLALIAAAVAEYTIWGRDLGNSDATHTNGLPDSQEHTLQILALVFSSFSVASAILAFYWFIKMRRSFRHDLVMLLIQSDMFKALWFMIHPIVTFARGPVLDSSRFCQVNGFFLSVGIEASDVAVLMIAVHSALYIFKPRVISGEGGLYPYRRVAYAIWLVYPLTMASLAFVNKENAYVNGGTYCYLPIRPFWYRLALAWVPRYIIFLVILGIYASIYFYVRAKFHGFAKTAISHSDDSNDGSERGDRVPQVNGLPQTPPLVLNGLAPKSRPTSRRRQQSISTVETMETIQNTPLSPSSGAHRFIWSNLISISPSIPTGDTPPVDRNIGTPFLTAPSSPQPIASYPGTMPTTPHSALTVGNNTPHSRVTSFHDSFVTRVTSTPNSPATARSIVDIFTVLESQPAGDDQGPEPLPITRLRLVNSRGQDLAVSELLRTRDKIRRQLRFLFIYPLVYIGMWLVPFVSHILQYRNQFTANPPFVLGCITTICLASQAAVDCWLFSTREKPWRHIPGNSGSFFGSLRFWTGWRGLRKRRVVHGPGKTRDEMIREARAAYRRRDEEMAIQQQRLESASLSGHALGGENRRTERSWWEVAGLDAGMSPLTEETPNLTERGNPMEEVRTASPVRTDRNANALKINVIPPSSPEFTNSKQNENNGANPEKKI